MTGLCILDDSHHVIISKLACVVNSHQINLRFDTIPMKIPAKFVEEIGKLILTFMWESHGPRIFKILR